MTCDEEAHLFSNRIEKLKELIDDHVQRGSLDEGNAAVFDPIIEAWLQEELAAVDRDFTASVREEADRLSAAHAEREASRARAEADEARAAAEEARAASVRDERRRVAETAAKVRTARYVEEVHSTKRRLEAAERQLEAATDLLLGRSLSAPVVRPVADHPAARFRPATVLDAVPGEVVEPSPVRHRGNDGVNGTGEYGTDDYGTDDYGTVEYGIGEYRTGEFGTGEFGTDEFGTDDDGTSDQRMPRGA